MIRREFKLNIKLNDRDIDYLLGAGLSVSFHSLGTFVSNSYGECLTEHQVRALANRGYHTEFDPFSRKIKKRKSHTLESPITFTREELEEKIKNNNLEGGRIQQSLIELIEFGGFLDPSTLRIMQEGYKTIDTAIEQESHAYMDCLAQGKFIE